MPSWGTEALEQGQGLGLVPRGSTEASREEGPTEVGQWMGPLTVRSLWGSRAASALGPAVRDASSPHTSLSVCLPAPPSPASGCTHGGGPHLLAEPCCPAGPPMSGQSSQRLLAFRFSLKARGHCQSGRPSMTSAHLRLLLQPPGEKAGGPLQPGPGSHWSEASRSADHILRGAHQLQERPPGAGDPVGMGAGSAGHRWPFCALDKARGEGPAHWPPHSAPADRHTLGTHMHTCTATLTLITYTLTGTSVHTCTRRGSQHARGPHSPARRGCGLSGGPAPGPARQRPSRQHSGSEPA